MKLKKRIKLLINAKICRDGKNILECEVICKIKSPYDILILNQPKKGLHLHIEGLSKGVITNEQKRGTKEKHSPLTAENFDKLKD